MAVLIFVLTSDVLQPLQLVTEPVGADGLKELLVRDPKRHGVLLSVSNELRYVKEAAAYIRLIYEGGTDATGAVIEAAGVEGLVTLNIYEQDPNLFRPEFVDRKRLDLTTYQSAEDGVTAKLKETGFATALLNRESTAIDLLGNESLSGYALPTKPVSMVTLHSQQTLQRFDMRQTVPDTTSGSGLVYDNGEADDELSLLLYFGMNETLLNEFDISPFASGPEPGDRFSALNIPFYRAKARGAHTVDLQLFTAVRAKQTTGGYYQDIDIRYEFRSVIRGVTTTTPLIPPFHKSAPFNQAPLPGGGNDETFVFNTAPYTFGPFEMSEGDELYLYGEVYVHNPSSTPALTTVTCKMGVGSYLKVTAPTTTAPTQCPALLIHEAFERCAEACTDQRSSFYSEYFGRPDLGYMATGPGALRIITNGFQLRGFPLPDAPAPVAPATDPRKTITAAYDALYNAFDAIDCLGMATEQRGSRQVVRVEDRAHFYQSTETLRLGAATDLQKSPYTPWLYSSAEFGYTHWQSGSPNGLDEFNSKRTYALPLTQVKATYSALSTVNAAGYLIEEARRDRYIEGATKEGQADAETFVVCVRSTIGGLVSEKNEAFSVVSGIVSPPTAYNLRLSPSRMLRAHGRWLRAGLYAQQSKRLLIGAVEGNAHLGSQLLSESAPLLDGVDVPVTDLPTPLVVAETYTLSLRVRRGEWARLKQNPYGKISFLDRLGTRKSGHLLNAERDAHTGLTQFTLLRS